MHRAMLGVLVTVLTLGGMGVRGQEAARIDWLTDRKKAFDTAQKTGKPLWVLFR